MIESDPKIYHMCITAITMSTKITKATLNLKKDTPSTKIKTPNNNKKTFKNHTSKPNPITPPPKSSNSIFAKHFAK